MGIHDREYYQSTGHGQSLLGRITSTAVGTLILINVVVWLIQAFSKPEDVLGPVTDFLGASPSQVFGTFQVWRLLTANFAHDPQSLHHIFWNMLGLFIFGRDLEQVYGKRDFCLLYLGSGVVAVLAELIMLAAGGYPRDVVFGASGAVMAVLMVFTLSYPTRTILLFLVVPIPVWVLCILFIIGDLAGAFDRGGHVANFAHLAGFLMGFLFRHFDLRWVRLAGWGRRIVGSRRGGSRRTRRTLGGAKVIPSPREELREEFTGEIAAISERIDALLEKISTEGQESLTEEELEFLKENSGKYRSPRT